MTRFYAVLLILCLFTTPVALAANHGGSPANPAGEWLHSIWSFFNGFFSWRLTAEKNGAMIIPNGVTENPPPLDNSGAMIIPNGAQQAPTMDKSGAMIVPNG